MAFCLEGVECIFKMGEGQMADDRLKNERLAAIFMAGLLMFNYPLLSMFNLGSLMLGIPLLYLYLFGAWLGVIVLTALTMRGEGLD